MSVNKPTEHERQVELVHDIRKLGAVVYKITPVPKPRMTQSDRWKKRACVVRYLGFKDKVKELKITIEDRDHITFYMPMAKSWSKKKKVEMVGKLHKQKPDVDNLCKALMDSIFEDDCEISDLRITKIWDYDGKIIIKKLDS